MKKKVFVVTLVVLVSFLLLADTSKAFENSVAGIFLDDAKSMKRIFPDGKLKLIEKNGYHVNIENKKQTEVFSAFFCEGDATLCFSIFVVKEKLNNFKEPIFTQLKNIDNFVTAKGIKLGLSKVEVIKILGGKFEIVEKEKGVKIIKYNIKGKEKFEVLKKYNVPEYFGEYIFKNDKLVEFSFGFPCE